MVGSEPTLRDLPALREAMAAEGSALPAPDVNAEDHRAGGVPLRLYRPIGKAGVRPPILMFLHGGGWVLGDLETHDACCRQMCAAAGCVIVAVDYRLAPEHPFPAALEDVMTAWRWVRSEADALGCDPRRAAIGGESAGANLAAALTLVLRDERGEQPLFQLLVHPPTDLRLEQPSIDTVPGMSRSFLEECIGAYAGHTPLDDPRLSPLRAGDLANLAPAMILTVENDPLRDDGESYALALARAGNDVGVQRLPDLPHGFMFLPATRPEVAASFRLLGGRVARYFRTA
ncbi:alpha/beta hydrolase [Sphingomonas sp. RIT328]|uniref:alpha/beta hydrolase n=1 Tax=Sphingomonas sp. RIT328 TaxID=1470591 RepID=UPI000452FA96|nr:alpha/beta hydrolase [Sphingomonas sp. RIT328]EZP50034.1 putative lipase [Sphingomonas sp. RIT328]